MSIRISLLLVSLLVSGCATFPDKLQVEDASQLVSYQDAASKAEQLKGKTLRWGGAIAKVENKPDYTVLEMVHYPLNGYGKPISGDESIGRYRVHVNGFMDPMVYQVGRLMTFTAELDGVEQGMVGEHQYVFPKANVLQYHLWKNVQRIDISSVHIWPYHRYGLYPRAHHRRVVIRDTSNHSRQSTKSSRPSGATTLPRPVNVKKNIK